MYYSSLEPISLDKKLYEDKTTRGNWILLTNFDKKSLTSMKISIELYNQDNGQYQLEIQSASNQYSDYGLWYKNGTDYPKKDLGPFWRIFEVINLG